MSRYERFEQNTGPLYGKGKGVEFYEESERLGFIRKVYSIVGFQLLFTVLFIILSLTVPLFLAIMLNPIFIILAAISSLITFICLTCFRNLARTVPTNYVLLFVFTWAESVLVSFSCVLVNDNMLVIQAALLTAVVVLALTIHAFTTKEDYTVMGAGFFCLIFLGIASGFCVILFDSEIMEILYLFVGILMFSMFLIYDTQKTISGHSNQYEIDEYVLAAMNIYYDIIVLFKKILELLMKLKKKND
jgi:protein lifeguard